MLRATKQQPITHLAINLQQNNKKNTLFPTLITQTTAKFIKLRPKSQSDIVHNFSFNLFENKKDWNNSPYQNQRHNHSLFLVYQNNYLQEKPTKRTSIEKSFREQSEQKKDESLMDIMTVPKNQKNTPKESANSELKKRGVIKLKRGKRQYSPINKLMDLQNQKNKGKIYVFTKEVNNNKQ